MSILSGLVSTEGGKSGTLLAHLGEQKQSYMSVEAEVICQLNTAYESVDISRLDRQVINERSIGGVVGWWNKATHLVVGIRWGSIGVGSLQHANSDDKDKRVIRDSLEAVWRKCEKSSAAALTEADNQMMSRVRVRLYGDLTLDGLETPRTIGECC